ncbi:MAG: PilZ domain-containing protein [Actinobacteria bacterium]|nr:PilZ domain-containing protein [Actinomycetota bacterium]MBW3649179.1 PilZ domain-containing protein [Actinomycetota bacterium]
MPFAWKPAPGQVALIELSTGGNECLTGVVLDDDGEGSVVVDLGASPRPPQPECEVVASFFAPDALYRMKATLSPHGTRDAVIDLNVHDVERVQRRTAPRARLSIPVVLSNFDDPAAEDSGGFTSVVGQSLDIGEGGCRVLVPKPFPSGCDPTVTLQLPTGDRVVALGAVLQASAAPGGGYEYRLVFLEMEELDRLRLAELVATPAPA